MFSKVAVLAAFAGLATAQLKVLSPGGSDLWWGEGFLDCSIFIDSADGCFLRILQSPTQTTSSPGTARNLKSRTSRLCASIRFFSPSSLSFVIRRATDIEHRVFLQQRHELEHEPSLWPSGYRSYRGELRLLQAHHSATAELPSRHWLCHPAS